ncbi:MAG: hypothetical protein ABI286_12185 [Edaphobacter sp.]
MLDVHPPHEAAHTWKDFFIHIITIVVGLCIAVGLEQTVEFFHHRRELRTAREEINDDLMSNRRGVVRQLECVHAVQAELKADMALLLAHRATERPLNGTLHFDWSFLRTRSAAWQTAKQSGAVNLMPYREQTGYEYTFGVAALVMDSAEKWQIELETAKAIATRAPDGALSPQDTNELITAISDTEGKLARTERLITFEQGALAPDAFAMQ